MALFPSPFKIDDDKQQLTRTDKARIVNIYEDDLLSDNATYLELQAWGLKWKETQKPHSTCISLTIQYIHIPNPDKKLYPNVRGRSRI